MSKKKMIETWRQVTKAKLNADGELKVGGGIYDTKNFTAGKVYEVIGVVWFQYEDRSGNYCYLIQDDSGTVRPVAMEKFEAVEISKS